MGTNHRLLDMKNSTELRKYKRQMRRNGTPAERLFKGRLDAAGIEHVCQCVIGFYVADFAIPRRMLVVELDGSSHNDRAVYDQRRDEFVRSVGFSVLRLPNRVAGTFDLAELNAYGEHEIRAFRSALGKANAERSKAIRAARERVA